MLFAVFLYFHLLLSLLLCLSCLDFFIVVLHDFNLFPVLHVFGPSLPFLLLLLSQGCLCLHFEEFSFLHFIFILVDILLDDLLVLLFEVFLELFVLNLLFLLDLPLLLISFFDLVLLKTKGTMVSS